jgi:predicted outer membrane repeat protein
MIGKFPTTAAWLMVALWAGASGTAKAATLAVPQDYHTITAAFAAANRSDRIEISPGVYREFNLELPSGVSVVGVGSTPADVVLDGNGQGRILLAEGLDESSLVSNLTFINGRATGATNFESSGGAIFCGNSSLRISNCVFEGNVSDGQGGAIRCNNSTPLITACVFVGNAAINGGGGAIDCSFGSSPLIQGCEFRGNSAAWGGALSCRGYSSPSIYGSLFDGNEAIGDKAYGGAVFADFASAPHFQLTTYVDNGARYGGAIVSIGDALTRIENCTLTANAASVMGGGLFSHHSSPRVDGSIFAFQSGTGISAEGGSAPVITSTDIFGNSRGDWVGDLASQLGAGSNISADPLFCNQGGTGLATYNLNDNSPCRTGELASGYMGAWPIGCDTEVTTVSTFAADWQGQQAQLEWQVRATGGTMPQFRLTGARSDEPDNEWDVAFEDLGGGYFMATDPNAGEEITYVYRLYTASAGSEWSLVREVKLVVVPDYAGIRDLKAWPNPFNPMTTISFRLGQAQLTRVSVYSPGGRLVAVLAQQRYESGPQQLTWDGHDSLGKTVGSGTYIVLVEGSTERQTHKITMLK